MSSHKPMFILVQLWCIVCVYGNYAYCYEGFSMTRDGEFILGGGFRYMHRCKDEPNEYLNDTNYWKDIYTWNDEHDKWELYLHLDSIVIDLEISTSGKYVGVHTYSENPVNAKSGNNKNFNE